MVVSTDAVSNIVNTAPWRLIKVIPLKNYRLEVDFVDGTHGLVDMSNLILSDKAGVFEVLKNTTLFNQVYLNFGAATWPGDLDLAPDVMHSAIKETGIWIVE